MQKIPKYDKTAWRVTTDDDGQYSATRKFQVWNEEVNK